MTSKNPLRRPSAAEQDRPRGTGRVPLCCRDADDGQCPQHRQAAQVLGHVGLRRHAPAKGQATLGDPGKAKPATDQTGETP